MKTRKILFCLLFIFGLHTLLIASSPQLQKVKIVKIIDTNRFQLEDGRLISLANLQIPSVTDTNKFSKALTSDILQYERKYFLNRVFWILPSPEAPSDSTVLPVHLIQKFLFNQINYNQLFLEQGFAIYKPIDSLYQSIYLQAEKKARAADKGIWNLEEYFLKKQFWFFAGSEITAGYFYDDFWNEDNNYQIISLQFSIFNLYNWNTLRLKIGQLHNLEQGNAACEMPPVVNYKVHSIYRYLIFSFDSNFRYFGFTLGMFGLDEVKRGFCQEGIDRFILPMGGIRFGMLKWLYLSAEFFTRISPLTQLGIHYHINRQPFSRISVYVSSLAFNDNWADEDSHSSLGIGIQHLFHKRYLLGIRGNITPYQKDKSLSIQIALRLN